MNQYYDIRYEREKKEVRMRLQDIKVKTFVMQTFVSGIFFQIQRYKYICVSVFDMNMYKKKIHICTYIYIYTYMYIYMYVYKYIYMYIYVHTYYVDMYTDM